MTYEDWQASVPECIKQDTSWRMQAYRLGLFVAEFAHANSPKLFKDRRTQEHADQIMRSTARVSACIVEGYSRGTGKKRARYYEFALGSTREARDWYFNRGASWRSRLQCIAWRL